MTDKKLPVLSRETEQKHFKRNPTPKAHYQMILKIENAPGSFDNIESSISYEAPNCTYKIDTFAGAAIHPEYSIPIVLEKIGEDLYQTDFYLDAMQDEDYYGQGLSQWRFRRLIALFSATHSASDTQFSASFSLNALEKRQLEIHHLMQDYPKTAEVEGDLSTGINPMEFQPDEYFTFNIEIKKI